MKFLPILLFISLSAHAQRYPDSGNATSLQGRALSATAPTSGQVILWNSSASQWRPGTSSGGSGTVTSVTAGTGATGGTITATGTIGVDVGTAANKIVQVTSGTQYPAIDGFLITNLNALTALTGDVTASGHGSVAATVAKLQGVAVATTSPTSGQVLTYNSTLSQWKAQTGGGGGATTALDNIASTQMSASLVWGVAVVGLLKTNDRNDGIDSSTDLSIQSGNTGANAATGAMSVRSGTSTVNASGLAIFGSGNSESASGATSLVTGTANGATGNTLVSTGAATGGNSGSITLQSGTATGTRGSIKLVDGSETCGTGCLWNENGIAGAGAWSHALATANSSSGTTLGYSFTSGTVTAGTGISGAHSLITGDYQGTATTATNTGAITIQTGANGGPKSPSTGDVNIVTGQLPGPSSDGTSSGRVEISTGSTVDTDPTTTLNSGGIRIKTGNSTYQSGNLEINTGDGTVVDNAFSGLVFIETGNVTGTAASGSISLVTGSVGAGGSRGTIVLGSHTVASGSAPAVSSCGTGTPLIQGSDLVGRIVVGGGVIGTCTITFSEPWAIAPVCVVEDESHAVLLTVSPSTTDFVVTGTSLTGDVLGYHCLGFTN